MTKEKILSRLSKQEKIEGKTSDTDLLKFALPFIKTGILWEGLTQVKHHRYGTKSYECYVFYYPTEEFKAMVSELKNEYC